MLEARLPCGGANSIFLCALIHQKVNEPNIAEPAATISCQINQMRMHSNAKIQKFKNFLSPPLTATYTKTARPKLPEFQRRCASSANSGGASRPTDWLANSKSKAQNRRFEHLKI